jgi:hypothetical protein
MKSQATTVPDYLASLPDDRRAALETVREVIRKNLDKDYDECMVWGVAAYTVPHRVFPAGHHTDPKKPLMMCGFSSQKNDMVVYMLNVSGAGGWTPDKALAEWFKQAWAKTGKPLGLEVGGGGCCVRFRKIDDVALDVIGESIRRTPAKAYVESYVGMLADRGKGADGKKLKSESPPALPAKNRAAKVAKKVGKKTVKRVAKKAAKR